MRSLKILALFATLNTGALMIPQEASARQVSISFQLFYDELSPYGMWVDYPNYGYVWIPDVDQSFSPYGTDGRWVFTYHGWTWVSNYSWGWAPFHYGRWDYDNYYGWLWVPNDEWGPAWVTWRRSEGYYGWAPMGPGISVEFSFGREYRVPNERWIFVRDRDINRPDIDRYYVDRSTNVRIINNSTVINNTYTDESRHAKYVAGPPRDDVQKFTGTEIKPVTIREKDKPGHTLNNDQLQIYRPRVQTSNNNDRKPVPPKLVNLKEVKPISERKPGNQRRNENIPAPGKEQPSQPPNANPSDKKAAGEQPRDVNLPDKNKRNEQPIGTQSPKPSENKGKAQQPRDLNPPGKDKRNEQPIGTQSPKPSDNKGKVQKPREVNPPNKSQPPKPQDVNPNNIRGKEKQPRNIAPPDKNRKAQTLPPDTNQVKKKKK